MAAPIRSAVAEQTIINKGQHAIADLGLEIVRDAKRGVDNTDPDFRQKILKLVLLRMFLQNILNTDGEINNFYAAAANEKARNNILTGILKLSGLSGGPAIPKITGDNIPLIYYPSSTSYTSVNNDAVPGGITFENTNVDAPGEVINRIDASVSNFAFYIINVIGTGAGEGSRSLTLLVTWRGASTPVVAEYSGADVGGSTTGVTFSAALVSGFIEITANVPTDNWIIRGARISFYNMSFQNLPPVGNVPAGGTTGQFLEKASNMDYDFQFITLVWSKLTDVTASLAEINRVTGVTSPIQTQLDALTTALGNYLLLAGGTMSGAIAMGGNKITGLAAGTTNGDALRYEQLIGLYLLLAGGTMSGNIAMGGNKVTGLAAASGNGEAVRYEQVTPKADKLLETNRQTASYILVLGDADKIIEMNVGSANNLTVPPNSDVAFSVGTQILVSQYGTGQTTIVPGSGVTLRSEAGMLDIRDQYAGVALLKIATDEWYVFGALS